MSSTFFFFFLSFFFSLFICKLNVAGLSKALVVYKVYQTMFRVVKESETVDSRQHCFLLQSAGHEPRYLSVETRQELLRIENSWNAAIVTSVIKLGLNVAGLSKALVVYKVYQTMFRVVKESETVDSRQHCFLLQSAGHEPRYLSVETRQELLRIENSWNAAIVTSVIKLGVSKCKFDLEMN
uniref:Uncharacterized protein n=1 Tax=Glossina palpalis gambiensis TaxID=67801 RepID=A0A1B0B3H6_9MUSC